MGHVPDIDRRDLLCCLGGAAAASLMAGLTGRQHHIAGEKYGAIKYTEPFLNNQHIVEPTLYHLTRCATVSTESDRRVYRDHEGNVLARIR